MGAGREELGDKDDDVRDVCFERGCGGGGHCEVLGSS